MKLVTGAFPEPSMESELRPLWERNNDMLISWILNTVSESISDNLNFINSVSKLWDELQEHYAQIDGHRIFQLTNEMVQLKQDNCSVEVYYHKLKGFWDEYDALEAPYVCICACNYNNERINAAKVYTMVRQKEKQRETSNPKHQTSTILNSYTNQARPSTSNPQRCNPPRPSTSSNNLDRRNVTVPNTSYERKSTFRKGVYYGNYGKEGHYQEECYKIVGYPVGHPLHDVLNQKPSTIPLDPEKYLNLID
nr:cysteine-rich RLK (receptor-like protein kinase) 8 [Tanacetum cinerariifolium]